MDYLLRLAATAMLCTLLIAGFQWLMDPYALFGMPLIARVNDNKPALGNQEAEFKRALAERAKFETALIGNSRVNLGFAARPGFVNLGSGGQDIDESWDLLRLSLRSASIQQALLFLDLSQAYPVPADAAPIEKPQPRGLGYISRYIFSLATLLDSGATLLQSLIGPSGCESTPFDLATGVACRTDNAADDVTKKVLEEEKTMCDVYKHIDPQWKSPMPLKFLQGIIRDANQAQVRLKFVIAPVHVRHLALIGLVGRWESFRRFVEDVVRAGAEGRVEVWDFSLANDLTVADFPNAYFYESTHFKPALGEIVIGDVLEETRPARLGKKLTLENFQSHLSAVEARAKEWLSNHAMAPCP